MKIIIKYGKALSFLHLFFLLNASGQMNQIKIGDPCPNIKVQKIINYKSSDVAINDFRGKWLILDFWATWCKPCVGMLIKTDSLKNQLGDKVEFLPVTTEKKEKVTEFLNFLETKRGLKVASATEDTLLSKVFKHTYIPHYVWINPNGKIAAITGYDEITLENINKAINNEELNLAIKKDEIRNRDVNNPIFFVGSYTKTKAQTTVEQLEEGSLLFKSILMNNLKGVPTFCSQDSVRISCINQSIEGLYRMAAGKFTVQFGQGNSSIWEITNHELFHFSDDAIKVLKTSAERVNWIQQNTFSYELVTRPGLSLNERATIMLNDLNEQFGALFNIYGNIEKRKIKCLVLKQLKGENLYKATDDDEPIEIVKMRSLTIKNKPISNFINALRQPLQMLPPLVDGTEYNGKVNIKFEDVNQQSINEINQALLKYGLRFEEEIRKIDMVIVKDKFLK